MKKLTEIYESIQEEKQVIREGFFVDLFSKLLFKANESKFESIINNLPNSDPALNKRIVSTSQKLRTQLEAFEKQYANNPEVLQMIQKQLKSI